MSKKGLTYQILRIGMAAPSSGNQQREHFIVIDDKENLSEIPKFIHILRC